MSEQDHEGDIVSLAEGRKRFEAREAEARREQARAQAQVKPGEARPAPWVTYVLIGLNVAVWVVMVSLGVDPYEPSTDALIEFGGNFGIRTSNGQWWRLLTAMFLHGGIYHIGFNLYFMWVIGRVSEQIFGPAAYAVVYFGSGLLASMLSVAWEPEAVSVGASGALFGVFGALLGFTIRRRRVLPKEFVVMIQRNALILIGLNAVIAMFVPGIDIAAHVGGLVAGVGLGYLISRLAERPVSTAGEAKTVRTRAIAIASAATIVVLVAGGVALRSRWDDPATALTGAYNRAVAAETAYSDSADDVAKRITVLEQQLQPMRECVAELAVLERLPKLARAQVDSWTRYCDLAGQAFALELEGLRSEDEAALAQAAALHDEAVAALEPGE